MLGSRPKLVEQVITNKPNRTIERLVWSALVLTMLGVATAFIWSRYSTPAPAPELRIITQRLPSFLLTNQFNQPVTPASFEGSVVVADVVFTRCPGPCPKMTRHMAELQQALAPSLPVKFLTMTTDPDHDSPEVLKRYGEKYSANPDRWTFATGSKDQIALLARQGLKLVAEETKPEERVAPDDLFVHSTVFVILDKKGRLRGSFESTELDFQSRVKAAVKSLAKEN